MCADPIGTHGGSGSAFPGRPPVQVITRLRCIVFLPTVLLPSFLCCFVHSILSSVASLTLTYSRHALEPYPTSHRQASK